MTNGARSVTAAPLLTDIQRHITIDEKLSSTYHGIGLAYGVASVNWYVAWNIIKMLTAYDESFNVTPIYKRKELEKKRMYRILPHNKSQ